MQLIAICADINLLCLWEFVRHLFYLRSPLHETGIAVLQPKSTQLQNYCALQVAFSSHTLLASVSLGQQTSQSGYISSGRLSDLGAGLNIVFTENKNYHMYPCMNHGLKISNMYFHKVVYKIRNSANENIQKTYLNQGFVNNLLRYR